MARLSLRLPESLHHQLKSEARQEGVSVNQYLVYLLARRSQPSYLVTASTREETAAQATAFSSLLADLGTATPGQARRWLEEREPAAPGAALPPELTAALERRRQERG